MANKEFQQIGSIRGEDIGKAERRSTVQGETSKQKSLLEKEKNTPTFTSLVCMNQTEYKYYVFSQNGVLFNRVNFSDVVEQYGVPVAVSNNGQNFIFKKHNLPTKFKSLMKPIDRRDKGNITKVEQGFTLNVMHLTAFELVHIKEINV